jgi:hypothetical protein
MLLKHLGYALRPQPGFEAQSPVDRHRGGGHPPTRATPPCVRVRTRRFELVTLAQVRRGSVEFRHFELCSDKYCVCKAGMQRTACSVDQPC